MPNSVTASVLVDRATKCLATAERSPSSSKSHLRADLALVSVSCVVKVLLATVNSVVSGLTVFNVSARWVPSTLETKCARIPGFQYGRSASETINGPRSEPPMPMLTMSVMALPVWPRQVPECSDSVKRRILVSTAFTSGITSLPSTNTGVFERLRSAVCSTARPSVTLILSPLNMRSMNALSSACSARSTSRRRVSAVTRCLE